MLIFSGSLLLGAVVTALLLICLWVFIRACRDRDAFERASDSRLPSDDRVRAIAVLSKSAARFPRSWRCRSVPTLLSDLRSYDRSPVVREAAAAALGRFPSERARTTPASGRQSNSSSPAAPPSTCTSRTRPIEF
jgi:hypothetical protein